MKAILNPFPLGNSPQKLDRAPVRIVALNADKTCAAKARQICGSLVPEFGRKCEFDYGWWLFDELASGDTFKAAMDGARLADMIVIACRADRELSPVVRACLEMALAERSHPGRILVALLEESPVEGTAWSRPVDRYLRRIAHEVHMEYLVEWFEPAEVLPNSPAPQPPPKSSPVPAAYEAFSHPCDYRDWGIND